MRGALPIQHRQNLIILGATGTGKSWLGCAFATHACRHHYSVLYFNTNTLFEALALAVADRTLPQLRRKLINTNLLIIDDFGLGSIDSHLASIFLDIIENLIIRQTHFILNKLRNSKVRLVRNKHI